jgi:hypothetical protein
LLTAAIEYTRENERIRVLHVYLCSFMIDWELEIECQTR